MSRDGFNLHIELKKNLRLFASSDVGHRYASRQSVHRDLHMSEVSKIGEEGRTSALHPCVFD
jgi:hypothetical protein